MAIPLLEVMYVQVVFECDRCGRTFVRVFRGYSSFILKTRIINTACEVCKYAGGGTVHVIDMTNLPLQHLEEFMVWA